MKQKKRIILIVLDSFGIGAEPDAAEFGDVGTNTIGSCMTSEHWHMPHMTQMGLLQLDGVADLVADIKGSPDGKYSIDKIISAGAVEDMAAISSHRAAIARMQEASRGKDTTIGHWEIAGVISDTPLPTYPEGFPPEVLMEFSQKTGRGVLCNKPYSGTEVIKDYGKAHMESGDLIVYTSADSVFQIAAHEDVVPIETLYEYCHIAREMLQGKHGVGRVIARPFIGEEGHFTRTSRRHDYSLEPPRDTMLNILKAQGYDVIGIGKINDIFAGSGITEFTYTTGNADGIEKTLDYMDKDFHGLLFVNLVDFDMLYGHRNDIDGYAKALAYFDEKLPNILGKLGEDDVLMITADHGCDPGYTVSTDHSREYTPYLIYGKDIEPVNYGTRHTFADIAATTLKLLGVDGDKLDGESLL